MLWRPQNSQTFTDPTQISQTFKALKSLSRFSQTFKDLQVQRLCEPCDSIFSRITFHAAVCHCALLQKGAFTTFCLASCSQITGVRMNGRGNIFAGNVTLLLWLGEQFPSYGGMKFRLHALLTQIYACFCSNALWEVTKISKHWCNPCNWSFYFLAKCNCI